MRKLHKCKITVLDRLLVEDLAREYTSDPKLGPCDIYENGQEFILTEIEKPDGFCSWAWADIQRDVTSIMTGGNMPWVNRDAVQVVCCTDGFRPVIFKIERIED